MQYCPTISRHVLLLSIQYVCSAGDFRPYPHCPPLVFIGSLLKVPREHDAETAVERLAPSPGKVDGSIGECHQVSVFVSRPSRA
jgi:hypothetical protein